ncbi:GNAT family N-acetyltransferase [Candidatus Pelagibacter sp.]|nr:GNAT family N-acetyltransferase [Candidatus Pelagibacter sp.]
MLKSIEGNFDHPEVNDLLTKHFIELRNVSPKGSTHVLDIPSLMVPSIKFWSLWQDDNLMGCGALKFLDKDHGEFKSIRVHNNFRKKDNGIKLINHLIIEAKKLRIKRLSIETGAGDFFTPAKKLFNSCGFKPCPPFAHYKEDKNSLYLTKLIDNS